MTPIQLVETDFQHDDPESLPNMLAQMPETEEVPHIEFTYDTRGSGVGKVRCRHCRKVSANHFRGFVLKYSDGRRVLFGKDCGAKQFGETFNRHEAQFNAARKLGEHLKRKALVMARRRDAIDILDQIEGYQGWHHYSEAKRSFRHGMWFAVSALVASIQRTDGRLFVKEEVRDLEAEERLAARSAKNTQRRYKEIEREIGTLAGQSFFASGELPDRIVPDLVTRFKAATFHIDDIERVHELGLVFRGLETIVDDLEAQAARVDDMWAAMSEPNLHLLAEWLYLHEHGRFRTQEGVMGRYDAAGQIISVGRPEGYRVPAFFDTTTPTDRAPRALLQELRGCIRLSAG